MANFDLRNQPRYKIKTHDSDKVLTSEQFQNLFSENIGITLCIRSAKGHANRGGYYFCITKNSNNTYDLETLEGVHVDNFSEDDLLTLINHASGRKFNGKMLDYCQNSINFRTD